MTEYAIDLPEWKGKKAVLVADTHLGQVHGEKFSRKIAEKIKEIDPDIIFDAGDLFDGVKGDPFALAGPLSELKPPMGYYFATGNHEYYGDAAMYKDAAGKLGIRVLSDQSVEVAGVRIVGSDYGTGRFPKELPVSDMPIVLIKHVPLELSEAGEKGVDLMLSGHTHRAQMWPLMYITRAVYKGYDYGLKDFGSMRVLVTDGVGTWGPPMRVGTHSEIVVINFR